MAEGRTQSAGERATQDNRILKLSTPLGKDFLLIDSIDAKESISSLFKFELMVRHQNDYEPTEIAAGDILGKTVNVELVQPNGTSRHFHGIVSQFTQGGRDALFTAYRMEVVPQLWLLTQSRQSRIFQQMSVPDILKKVLKGIEFRMQVERLYEPRNYCVQYRESDFDFASRIMEEEGIFYYFQHTPDEHTMIIADTPGSHKSCPSKSSIDFVDEYIGEMGTPVVREWALELRLQTGRFEFRDHHFQLPGKKFEAPTPSRFNHLGNQDVEFYDYPGGYAKRFDGIDKAGGSQSGELQKVYKDSAQVAQSAVDALDAKHKTYIGVSDCPSFTAGHKFKINNLPIKENNREYALTSVTLHCDQSPDYTSGDELEGPFWNKFECIPLGDSKFPPFRPQHVTPKPTVYGSQTAYVVGPAGEQIYTDKFGRVKVQFHWDRHGKYDFGSACWLRVAQGWAGNRWGAMFIPRIGMEVLVHFLDGDPDQPIVGGCVYNPEAMPPYELPTEKTKSGIKSDSSKGGGGFNEFRIEDKKGSEQIFIHAEKNQDNRTKNDSLEWIGRDRHLIVKRDQIEKVEKDKHLQVKGDQTEKIDGNVHLKVVSNKEQKIGSKFAVDAGTEVHIKAGMSVTIEAGTQVTLKSGGSFVSVGPAGVFIKGPMVMLNSGGAAGSGSGASPGMPKDPLEADTANAGKSIKEPPPPQPPKTYAKMAKEARQAALEAGKKAEIDKYLASLPVPPDHEIIEALKKGVGHIFTAHPVNIPAVEKRLSERDYKELLDAAQWVPSPQGGKIKNPSEAERILTQALDAAKKDAGIQVRERFSFASALPDPGVPSLPAVPSQPAVKPEERPKNYSVYGQDEDVEEKDAEERPTNYQFMDEAGEVKDLGEKAPDPLPSKQREHVEQKDAEQEPTNYQFMDEAGEVKDLGEKAPDPLPSKQREDMEEKDAGEKAPAGNYQPYREGENIEEEKEIGKQAVSMVDAAKEGVPYVAYTSGGSGWNV